ncbi:hypothetical protein Tco_1205348, partial [Tanacetum coccineum]
VDELENHISLETDFKGLILTLCKVGGPLEATSLPSSMGKAVYISPLLLLDERRD